MGRNTLPESFYYAIVGVVSVFKSERNMKLHFFAALVVIILAGLVNVTPFEWAVLVLTIFLVLAAETINTAIEKTVDLVTDNYHPLAEKAKNMAAGAVLLSAANAVIIAGLIFWPYVKVIFSG
ncbi:MAG: diacylglycerol kinase family protein [Syntrophomonadaceae bacterium]|jgi:diacylglycerol kinase|nr:diacylglycerol kinase family protein [Syntrophomonadaceae bacterium]